MSHNPYPSENQREKKRDLEDDQGPGLGAHTGRDRTRIPEHSEHLHQGPKTTKANRDKVSRRLPS